MVEFDMRIELTFDNAKHTYLTSDVPYLTLRQALSEGPLSADVAKNGLAYHSHVNFKKTLSRR